MQNKIAAYSRGVALKTDENYGSISIKPPDCPQERIISAHICFKLAYNWLSMVLFSLNFYFFQGKA